MFINRQLGEYILLRRLAVGGQSEVFLALKQGPGEFSRPLVIKALPTRHRNDPRYVELFYREAFLSVRFAHPHVMTVHDMRVLGDEHCMIMDFISGQTVTDIAQRGFQAGTPLSINHVVQIIADAADGLDYAHQFQDLDSTPYSVVHRDVSPQNLMVTYQGVTRVFDFGIAQIQEDSAQDSAPGGGKYAYMSPEQCRNEPADARSDIFSLGIILYELCCGRRLFRRETSPQVIQAVTEEPIAPPTLLIPGFPPELETIIMRALARDPAERYQRAAEMRDDLLGFLVTRADGGLRRQLGRYVADLFVAEREDIARTMREAYAQKLKPKPVGQLSLEMLGYVEGDVVEEKPPEAGPQATQDKPRAREPRNEQDAGPESDSSEPAHDPVAPDGGQPLRKTSSVDRAKILEAKRKNKNLVEEVRRLQKRQNVLLVMLLVISLAAISVIMIGRLSADTPRQVGHGERIEMGSP